MNKEQVIDFYDSDLDAAIYGMDNPDTTLTNQTGGIACNHPRERVNKSNIIELPLFYESELYKALEEILVDGYGGWCCDGIKDHEADDIDTALDEHGLRFVVNRQMLDKCQEAWLYLINDNCSYIMVFENSD